MASCVRSGILSLTSSLLLVSFLLLSCCNNVIRVKSVNFGHRVNSFIQFKNSFANNGNPDQPSHQNFHCLLR